MLLEDVGSEEEPEDDDETPFQESMYSYPLFFSHLSKQSLLCKAPCWPQLCSWEWPWTAYWSACTTPPSFMEKWGSNSGLCAWASTQSIELHLQFQSLFAIVDYFGIFWDTKCLHSVPCIKQMLPVQIELYSRVWWNIPLFPVNLSNPEFQKEFFSTLRYLCPYHTYPFSSGQGQLQPSWYCNSLLNPVFLSTLSLCSLGRMCAFKLDVEILLSSQKILAAMKIS